MKSVEIWPTYGGLELLQNWRLVAHCAGVPQRLMGHARANRGRLQKRKKIGSRVVYRSEAPLKAVQKGVAGILDWALCRLPGNELGIGCRKGLNVHRLLESECTGKAVIVKTDIRGYYDHITRAEIEEALEGAGFVGGVPRMLTNLLVVDRRRKSNGSHFQTLQQGSPASPTMANLVGRQAFDLPIVEWLKRNMRVPYRYYRYSDNITLVLDEDPGAEEIGKYKKFVRKTAHARGYSTHGWDTLRQTNKALPQCFLGVVLNRKANLQRRVMDRLEGTMFRALANGMDGAAERHFKKLAKMKPGEPVQEMTAEERRSKFASSMAGYASYMKDVNPTRSVRAEKLSALLVELAERGRPEPVDVEVLRRCRNSGETAAQFVEFAMEKLEGR